MAKATGFCGVKDIHVYVLPVLGMVRRPPRHPKVALVLLLGSRGRVWL